MALIFLRIDDFGIVEKYIEDIHKKGEQMGYKININKVWRYESKDLGYGFLYIIYNPLFPPIFSLIMYLAFKVNLRNRYKYKGDITRYSKSMGILNFLEMY